MHLLRELAPGLRNTCVAAAVSLLVSACATQPTLDTPQHLNAFFEQVFERDLGRSPIRESQLGIKRHQDQWDDVSEEGQIESAALARRDLRALHRFDYDRLPPAAQLSYRLFEHQCRERLEAFQWQRSIYLVTQMNGPHRAVATTLLNNHPIADLADAEAYIARLLGVRHLMMQLVTQLERQERAGVQPPRFVYDLTIGEATNLITGRPFDTAAAQDSPVFADFKTKLARLQATETQKQQLLASATAALQTGFEPGYQQLIAHLREAQKTATDDAGVWKLANGDLFYRRMLQSYTTLPQTPQALHELGLQEVGRIQGEMRVIMQQVGFNGSLSEFFEHLRNDKRFYYSDSAAGREQYLADAGALLDEIRARQGEFLGRSPKMDVVVRAVEPWREQAAPKAFYASPPQDGSRPGIFYVNLYDMGAAPKYQLPVLLYHEAIPGHHVETVVAYELMDLPSFRKFASIAAFSEGWGLYSERLAKEIGLYADPYDDFGRLSMELMRAARLVVDTGLHAKRWTREQAIDYLDSNLPSSHYDNQREIERYIVLPGQATAYAVGMMKILELRARARQTLGAQFDLKTFHDVVLGSGPVPLPILEQNVDSWIKSAATR